VIAGIFTMIRSKKRRKRSYSY
ncbi:hypothetical protein PY726_06735, partial [Listeria monocytogenes]|nr:hypothetical protein [Listeria monocytogenes]